MQREEANERKRLGELQSKLDGLKIKEVALKASKPHKHSSSCNHKGRNKHQQVSPR